MKVHVTGKHPIASWLAAAACLALHLQAHAQSIPFTLTLGETVTHDDNLLRAAAGSEEPDWQSDTRLRLDYSDTLGRGRASAWAAADDSRYRHHTQLDNVGHQLGGELDWASLYDLSGKFGIDDNSSLYRVGLTGDQSFLGKSLLHTQRAFTRAALGGATPLGLEGGLEFSNSKNSASVLSANDVRQWVGDFGVTYAQNPDLKFSLLGRRTVGRYPNFVPAAYSFQRNDLVLGGNWVSGGFSSVDAQLAYSEEESLGSRTHPWTGFVRGNWQVTGHTQLSASFARDSAQNFMGGVLGQGANGVSQAGAGGAQSLVTQQSLSLNDAVNLAARWQPTSKIDVTGNYLHTIRHYDNIQVGTGVLNGSDTSNLYQIGLNYQLSRSIRTGCSGARATHAPGTLAALSSAYVSNAYSCFAELSLH